MLPNVLPKVDNLRKINGYALCRVLAGYIPHILENEMLNGDVIRLDGAIRMAPQ